MRYTLPRGGQEVTRARFACLAGGPGQVFAARDRDLTSDQP